MPSRRRLVVLLPLVLLSSPVVAHQLHHVPADHQRLIKRQILGFPGTTDGGAGAATTAGGADTTAGAAATTADGGAGGAAAATTDNAAPATTTSQGRIASFFSSVGSEITGVLGGDASTSRTTTATSTTSTPSTSSTSSRTRSSASSSSSSTSSIAPITSTSFFVPSSTSISSSATPSASASAAADTSSSSSGVGKKAVIIIAVIAAVVGAIAAIWTVFRKWKLSPSSRFARKMDTDLNDEFFAPRRPSFGEKNNEYYGNLPPTAHFRNGSENSSPNNSTPHLPYNNAIPPPPPSVTPAPSNMAGAYGHGYAEAHHEGAEYPGQQGWGIPRGDTAMSGYTGYGGMPHSEAPGYESQSNFHPAYIPPGATAHVAAYHDPRSLTASPSIYRSASSVGGGVQRSDTLIDRGASPVYPPQPIPTPVPHLALSQHHDPLPSFSAPDDAQTVDVLAPPPPVAVNGLPNPYDGHGIQRIGTPETMVGMRR